MAPEECLEHADSVYIGDAEFRWLQVVDDTKNGELRRVYRAAVGVPQPCGVQPRRDLFKGKGYLPITLMQFGRGCRFACDFCAISVYFNRTQFVRRTHEVLAEIENQDRKFIFFVDDNFLSDHKSAKLFLRELIPLKIRWVSQASIDMTRDLELMELLEESGCLGNVIGFESLDPQHLAHTLVYHIERPEPAARVERVLHEVHRPDCIGAGRHFQGHPRAPRQPLLRPSLVIQTELLVDPIHTFVIPRSTVQAKAVEALPEAPARVLLC
ncbi:MAG: radical SAM protein [Deltaproteobacteria bacterium]|nr:radical SAM protein [Deltaproteobacteria bacterium]